MNLLLFRADALEGDVIRATLRQSRHLIQILKAQPGDRIRVGAVDGLRGTAELLASDPECRLKILDLTDPPPAKLPVTLLLALPRPKVLRRILRAAAMLGVPEIILMHCWKVEKSYWQTPWLKTEAIEANLHLALEQCADTQFPIVQVERLFKPFVEDRLPALLTGCLGLLAHPRRVAGIPEAPPSLPVSASGRMLLAVGPEGGFSDYELRRLGEAGLLRFGAGPRILTVETAVPALLGQLSAGRHSG